jgi:hypothetical protein
MRHTKRVPEVPGRFPKASFGRLAAMGLIALLAGCSTTNKPSVAPVTTTPNSPVTYFAGAVAGGYVPGGGNGLPYSDANYLATYTVDDSMDTFAQFTYSFNIGDEQGPQMNYSGDSTALARGLLGFGITYSNGSYGDAAGNVGGGVSYNPPLGNNWAFELAGHSGGFVNLNGMPFVPLVNSQACPDMSKAQTYQFVTIPTYIGQPGGAGAIAAWNPQIDTAFGTVDVETSGANVNFTHISQFTTSGAALTSYQDLPNTPAAITSTTGACSPTFFGNTVGVPNPLTIVNPGEEETVTPGAIVGMGSTGLLVESNGNVLGNASNSTTGTENAPFQPFLGSGTGAMGLPQPSAPVSTSGLTGAQYLGIVYGGGTSTSNWTSLVASFGFSSMPANCPAGTFTTPLFGGDFPANNPGSAAVQANGGFGNCDMVIDLGTQDSSNNGLFPSATVTLYPGFQGSTTNLPHSFPATAIAGQLNGKYAIFLIGADTTGAPNQAWGIYLFQSN